MFFNPLYFNVLIHKMEIQGDFYYKKNYKNILFCSWEFGAIINGIALLFIYSFIHSFVHSFIIWCLWYQTGFGRKWRHSLSCLIFHKSLSLWASIPRPIERCVFTVDLDYLDSNSSFTSFPLGDPMQINLVSVSLHVLIGKVGTTKVSPGCIEGEIKVALNLGWSQSLIPAESLSGGPAREPLTGVN